MAKSTILNSVEEVIEDFRNGRIVIVVDDEDRENEGDFIVAAEKITPEIVNFMLKEGRGVLCAPLSEERCAELGLNMMEENNTSLLGTPFTVTVDLLGNGCTTGVSIHDRAATIRALADPATRATDLGRPGHINPLRARQKGVLRRPGHTEAAIDLARLAGLQPAGALIEIMNEDGTMARLGTFNLHASLLPQYRGAAPINWAVINGETETGVTTFLLNHEIDKGAIIGQVRVPILPEDNVGSLYDKLMHRGTSLVTETVDRIAAGDISPIEQQHVDESALHPAPKIFKEDCLIDWSWDGRRIVNFVRGLSPYPAAWTELYREGSQMPQAAKIYSAAFEPAAHGEKPGSIESDGRTLLRVACADGWITLREIQIAGKKRLAVRELLLGLRDIGRYRFRE